MKKVIHVDNSEFFRKQVVSFLSSEKIEVESFDSAQDAGMVIAGGGADMVIMGLTFADIEGEEFLSKAVEAFAGPVIVLSSSVGEAKKLTALGAKAVIDKSGSWKEELKPHLSELKK
ncbi:MAG: response regulator [Treponema sp.]|nr:response regulator [Treponema sp.]